MNMFSVLHVVLQCILTIGLAVGHSGSDVHDVMTLLFTTQNYNMKIRPLKDQLMVMDIHVDFNLNSIIEFDEANGALKTAGYLVLSWTDEYLQWDSTDFNGTESIFLPQDNIWKPDISLKNSVNSFTSMGSPHLNVFVTSTGGVSWYPYQVLQSTCDVDIQYFPFDVQTCSLVLTAWSYYKSDVTLYQNSESIHLDGYTPNSMWDILSTAARAVNTEESEVVFEIKMKRKPGFYIINIIVPVILLSILNTFSFVLPITSGERASFSVTVFLLLAVFLTIVAASLPTNSDSVSLLSVFLILMTASSTLMVALCLVQARLATRNTTDRPIGNGFWAAYKLANILRCRTCRRTQVKPLMSDNFQDVNWIDIVDSMDFLLFILFMTLTILSAVIIFVTASTH
ncbi:neuronal acetylcholine receptor subunit alpha-7-like isoform X2 [Dreissena polymorpha]|uniref:neuronal acetylcholine receptor subunit alpha-7-like isoform X2 n=1 Tax=Dreissena polymorpha TaxID=45954 RepID=UPI002263B9B9|nr:neuronal acetylcholine receptor subunit alpha-7-like isoform X2 [Dreissena polymorpha]